MRRNVFGSGKVKLSQRGSGGASTQGKEFNEFNPMLKDYNMLMSAMQVSVSKHLMEPNFHVVWANDYYYKATGYTKEEYDELFHSNCAEYYADEPEEYRRLGAIVQQAYESGETGYRTTIRMTRKDGSHLWINVCGIFTDEVADGLPIIYSTFTDVTDYVEMERERKVTYDKLPGFVARVEVTEQGFKLLYGNKKFIDFFGEIDENGKQELFEANLERCKDILDGFSEDLSAGRPIAFSYKALGRGGREAQFQISADCVDRNGSNPVYLVVYIDITEISLQRENFRKLAYEDPVTGGLNRTSFDLQAKKLLRAAPGGTYALVSINIQKFKVINDMYGIRAGDETLKWIDRKLKESLKEGEVSGRLSSDSFCLLLKAGPETEVRQRLIRVTDAINAYNINSENKYTLSFSAGVYYISEPELPMTQLHDRSILARKQRGVSGGGRLICNFYDNDEREKLSREKDIENRMEDALKQHQFVVYLQPKQSLATGHVAGAEALVRWLDPEKGVIPPDCFIPMFEANGFVVELDLYVFESVCRLMKKWLDEGKRPVPVSVNMSRVHFNFSNFLERYEAVRTRYGVPASLLEIEITETAVYDNPSLMYAAIDEIRGKGYKCSMDDFGSGYSSLNMLKDLKVDALKLDKAFFTSADMEEREKKVVGSIIRMAKDLKMATVAEGIESAVQANFLAEAGCDLLQGYYYSRPMEETAFEKFTFKK